MTIKPAKPALPPAILLFLRVMTAVFAAEALVMFVLAWLIPPLGDWLEALLDSTLLTLLVTPLLWRWLVVSDRQRRAAEDNLRLQSAALTAAADAIAITNRDGTILWANPAFTSLTGYAFAEVVGKNPWDLVKSGQQERAVYEEIWATILAGRVWHGQLVNRRKDGSFWPDEQTITPVRDATGKITHFVVIKRDLTKRNQAEAARRASEERYRSLFENMGEGLAYCQMLFDGDRPQDFVYLAVNHAFDTLTGLKDVVGRKVTEIIPGIRESDPGLFEIYGRVARGGAPEKFEIYVEALKMWFAISVYCSGQDHFVAVFDVITERKRAQAALRQSEERYRLLFENNPLPMWLYDLETLRFLAVNEAAVQHYGYTREEFLGMTIKQIRPEEDIAKLLEPIEEGRGETKGSSEWRHRRKDGTIIHVEIISRPLVFDGRDARLVLASDITEKKLLEDKFLHAQRLESLGMLASGIAHDLNNVLAPIIFAGSLLRESLSRPGDLKTLAILERSAERGAALVRQILGFAHRATGESQLTQVRHLARDVINLIEATFPKSIQIEHQVASDAWPVIANPTHVHQVLMNLCVNARDAMPHGGTLRLGVANRRLDAEQARAIPGAQPGSWLVLEVADTGAGIPPETLARIWEPFFTTKEAGKGTGLGLSTVRGIVASHNGFIELQTEVGKGTTFRAFLPAAETELPGDTGAAASVLPRGHGELILVVDDDQLIRDIVGAVLSQHGYRVVSCADGVAAIARFTAQSGEIALVVTDVDMPNLGGVVLARVLLQLHPAVRLLAMSGLSGSGQHGRDVRAIRELAHAFLLKPFSPEDLFGTVHRLLHPPDKP